MTTPEKSFVERLRDWWQNLRRRPLSVPPAQKQAESTHETNDAEQGRYEVSDASGGSLGSFMMTPYQKK